MSDAEQASLREFVGSVAIALSRKRLTDTRAAIALLTAIDSKGMTGTEVVVNAEVTANVVGISVRHFWREFTGLCDAGWFEQTDRPARAAGRRAGRRARYRCMCPNDLGLDDLPDRLTSMSVEMTDDSEWNRVTSPGVEVADLPW